MPKTQMLINYVPGEECRVAILEDGKLEEYHAEPTQNISRVNNIYVGKVKNVESAIQAAFVDFWIKHAGFLHVSDLHPMYFPGQDDETTERVGKKTPRRDRPPIQQCLKKGQEVVVQVLKEGVGTKGPTVTSYLSIPGRYLVMMPQMDRVGVSRKVEDEDQRKQMRDILNQLDLPEGFGFILRTAGFERNKTELKRDLAYLQRLWKDMDKRLATGKGPRPLYAESDLLVRALRDWLTTEIDQVVIDHPSALARAANFMKIVAPRASVKLMQYKGKAPMYHAFGVEEQVLAMHAHDVPLPSGGRLVIDETEALVAIDVNSGKSRSARDAETNAYQTNLEAVDEICRQLRLRDLGGLVINDLIDMRISSNRKKIEQRFRDRLKRDRARSTILPISNFGILEMTRQRQRSSHERTHFVECPTCHGRGLVQKPASVAVDALREIESVLAHDKAKRAELVVSPRLASELLSSRRQSITRLERAMGKTVDVRVSEAIAIDRFTIYVYDEQGSDLKLDRRRKPKTDEMLAPWTEGGDAWAVDPAEETPELEPLEIEEPPISDIELLADVPSDDEDLEDVSPTKKKRRRRRRRRSSSADPSEVGATVSESEEPASAAKAPPQPEVSQEDPAATSEGTDDAGPVKKKRRRRRGKRSRATSGTSSESTDDQQTAPPDTESSLPAEPTASDDSSEESAQPATTKKKPRRRRSRKKAASTSDSSAAPDAGDKRDAAVESKPRSQAPDSQPRTRTRSTTSRSSKASTAGSPEGDKNNAPPPRTLYGASRRRLSPSDLAKRPKDR